MNAQKSEHCQCGQGISVEGTPNAVVAACENFRTTHHHHTEQDNAMPECPCDNGEPQYCLLHNEPSTECRTATDHQIAVLTGATLIGIFTLLLGAVVTAVIATDSGLAWLILPISVWISAMRTIAKRVWNDLR